MVDETLIELEFRKEDKKHANLSRKNKRLT